MTVRLLRGNTSERDELEQATTSPPHSRTEESICRCFSLVIASRERERAKKKLSFPLVMTKARRRRREEKRRFLSVNSPALSPTTSAHSSTMRKKKRSIRTSAVAFAKIAIPLSFAPFASRTFLATFNFVNRLVSNDDENEEEEEEDVAEDAMRVFEDFLCERANCEQEMCVDAVVDANMFVFDRDVYVFGLFVVVNNFTRSD